MNRSMKFLVLGFLVVFAACSGAQAAENDVRQITVTGDADVLVKPDEAVVRFSVQTKDKDLDDAVGQNDSRTARVLRAMKKLGVSARHIKTDHMNIWPEYHHYESKVKAYRVRKSITVTVKDTDKLEDVLKKAIDAGANGIDGVQFRSTDLRKHKDKARLMAVKAAREKAVDMAGALGQKIGRPRTINEQPSNYNGWGGWWGGYYGNVTAQNAVQNVGPAQGATGEITALGQIRINAKVMVAFELK
jgi:uncharacterized protein YggE